MRRGIARVAARRVRRCDEVEGGASGREGEKPRYVGCVSALTDRRAAQAAGRVEEPVEGGIRHADLFTAGGVKEGRCEENDTWPCHAVLPVCRGTNDRSYISPKSRLISPNLAYPRPTSLP